MNRCALPFCRKVSLSLLLLFIAFSMAAQTDSLAVVQARWDTKKVTRGIRLKHYWFEGSLFGSSQNINILEVKLKGRNKVDVEAEAEELKRTSAFGEEHGAIAALNGTFFDMKNGGSVDYIRLNGAVFNQNRLPKNGMRARHQKAAVVIDGRKVRIEQWDGSDDWEQRLPGEDVLLTGPLLLKDHRLAPLDSAKFSTARHPRTAIAIKGNKVLFITVDGRHEKAAGMSLYELAAFLKWIKAEDAVNLDGGGSTTMWVRGFSDGGIVNHPSDNPQMMQSKDFKPGMDLDNFPASEKWDREGERPVANVLIVRKRK